jgi:hypothetical protein
LSDLVLCESASLYGSFCGAGALEQLAINRAVSNRMILVLMTRFIFISFVLNFSVSLTKIEARIT